MNIKENEIKCHFFQILWILANFFSFWLKRVSLIAFKKYIRYTFLKRIWTEIKSTTYQTRHKLIGRNEIVGNKSVKVTLKPVTYENKSNVTGFYRSDTNDTRHIQISGIVRVKSVPDSWIKVVNDLALKFQQKEPFKTPERWESYVPRMKNKCCT